MAFLLLLAAGSAYIVLENHETPHYVTDRGAVFGTTYRITYAASASLQTEIEERLARVDSSLSPFNPASVISAVNRNRPAAADSMFARVFVLAGEVWRQTGGAFDITVAPIVNAWGFGFEKAAAPDSSDIDSLRRLIGFQKVRLAAGGGVVKDDPRIMLDCSAIAKGYGCDEVARLLDEKGVGSYMVEIGGEIVTKGRGPEHAEWNIGISRPEEGVPASDAGLLAALAVTDCAIATSGNYRRFYYKDGRKYAHTIDPRTGRPAENAMLSATVVAPGCAAADAFATAFMVLGPDSAQAVLRSNPKLQALLVYTGDDGKPRIWVSERLKNKVRQIGKT